MSSISDRTFFACTGLIDIVLPDSIVNINSYAFIDCSSLTHIYYNGTIESWNQVFINELGNDAITIDKLYLYSDTYPEVWGQYWHYVDSLATAWEPINYNITYILDGGLNDENNPVSYNVTSPTFTINDPQKDDYIFTGWTYNGQDLPTKNPVIEQGSIGDIEFEANWYYLEGTQYNTDNTQQDETGV
jgi:uncharacterized repeat protein (TIGR02543 family)